MKVAVILFALFFSAFAIVLQGIPVGGDAAVMFLLTESLVEDQDVFIPENPDVYLVRARGGKYTSRYGLGQSIVEIPLYLLGRRVAQPASARNQWYGHLLEYFVTAFTTPLISAAWCTLVFLFGIRLGFGVPAAAVVSILMGFATLVLPHSKTLFTEPLQGLLLTAACYFAVGAWRPQTTLGVAHRGNRTLFWSGFSAGFLVLVKSVNVLLFPLFVAYILWKNCRGDRPVAPTSAKNHVVLNLIIFTLPFLFFAALMFYYNYARFGSIWTSGYFGDVNRDSIFGFLLPLWVGLYGLIFSAGKGIIFYVPLVWLLFFCVRDFYQRRRDEAVLFAAICLVFLIVYGKWNQWHGDYTWGPRFLVPLMGLMVLPLGYLFRDVAEWQWKKKFFIACVIAASIFVQALGSAVNFNEYIQLTKSQIPYGILFTPGRVELRDDLLLDHFVPEFSPLSGHWWLLKHTVLNGQLDKEELREKMKADFPWKNLAPYAVPPDPTGGVGWDFWWRYFPEFFPNSLRWVIPLLAVMVVMFLASFNFVNYMFCSEQRRMI
ncbi:MAG: hypothetical protein AB1546_05915 [bacterium]